jgi:outer membrane immunogenic protein
MAADMGVYKAAPLAVSDWSGWYIGINGGYAGGRTDPSLSVPPNVAGIQTFFNNANITALTAAASLPINSSGGLVGGQFGYLMQSGSVVAGFEAAFDWMKVKGSTTAGGIYPNNPGNSFNFNNSVSSDWLFTFLGRVGLDLGSWYPYVTTGLAVASLTFNQGFNENFYPATGAASFKQTKAGMAFGGGLEWRLDRHWSLRGEGLLIQFNDVGGTWLLTNPAAPATNFAPMTVRATFREAIGRAALSYKF